MKKIFAFGIEFSEKSIEVLICSFLPSSVGIRKENRAEMEKSEANITKFLVMVKSYTEVTELMPEILNSFIDKIYVGKPTKIDGKRMQEVRIVYKLVGATLISSLFDKIIPAYYMNFQRDYTCVYSFPVL